MASNPLHQGARQARCWWLMPSFSGGRDQEDLGSKLAWANSLSRPYLKNTFHKNRADGMVQGEGPEFKPQDLKIK
jgi:hypothetical protein